MSIGQDYFPPQGTKYKWWHKTLNYSPWNCRMWDHWPASINLSVDKVNINSFAWYVRIYDFYHGKKDFWGTEENALAACLAAERVGDAQKDLIWLPWMETAVKAGWRPPCQSHRK